VSTPYYITLYIRKPQARTGKPGVFSDNISISLFGPRGDNNNNNNNNNNNTEQIWCFADVGSRFSCGVIAASVLAGRS